MKDACKLTACCQLQPRVSTDNHAEVGRSFTRKRPSTCNLGNFEGLHAEHYGKGSHGMVTQCCLRDRASCEQQALLTALSCNGTETTRELSKRRPGLSSEISPFEIRNMGAAASCVSGTGSGRQLLAAAATGNAEHVRTVSSSQLVFRDDPMIMVCSSSSSFGAAFVSFP